MNQKRDVVHYWLALHRAPRLNPNKAIELLEYFSSVEEIFRADDTLLRQFGIKPESRQYIRDPDWQGIEKDLQWLSRSGHHVVSCKDAEFPFLLKQIDACPLLLFVDGDIKILNTLQLSMVGSRKPTAAGKRIAYEFAIKLSEKGFIITSGLALGIDFQSHRGALQAKGKTIAVLGNGIDNIYPVRHRKLAEEIKENGAVISEFPPSTPPLPQNFPRRNRIISGLSVGTLVVEAAKKSGSLITARLANEQGREVFAVPGSVLNPMSSGCHRLLKEGAKLTETVDDIIEELSSDILGQLQTTSSGLAERNDQCELDHDHKALLDAMGFEAVSIDSLVEQSGLTAEVVSSMLLNIEMAGHIQSQLGGSYIRITNTNE